MHNNSISHYKNKIYDEETQVQLPSTAYRVFDWCFLDYIHISNFEYRFRTNIERYYGCYPSEA